jgi:cytochrome c553
MRRQMRKCVALALTLALAALPRAAAGEDYSDIKDKLKLCFSCHGPNGASTDPSIPIIAGQHMYYLYTELKDFSAGRRQNEKMSPVVAGLDKTLLKKFAQYFSEQQWPKPRAAVVDEATLKKAQEVAASAECFQCHLSGYEGTSGVPRLAGQHETYLWKTIRDLKSGARANSAAMSSLMRTFSDADLAEMVKYLASL